MTYLLVAFAISTAGRVDATWLRPNVVAGLSAARTVDEGHPMGAEIVIRANRGKGWKIVWRHRGLNPWKLLATDVDGDGVRELAVGVWKKSRFDPTMEKRVFIYRWTGKLLQPKWLGSRLTRRFDDFAFSPSGRLFALERGEGGKRRVSGYDWAGFGFRWLGATEQADGLAGLECRSGTVGVSQNGVWLEIRPVGERLELVRR